MHIFALFGPEFAIMKCKTNFSKNTKIKMQANNTISQHFDFIPFYLQHMI